MVWRWWRDVVRHGKNKNGDKDYIRRTNSKLDLKSCWLVYLVLLLLRSSPTTWRDVAQRCSAQLLKFCSLLFSSPHLPSPLLSPSFLSSPLLVFPHLFPLLTSSLSSPFLSPSLLSFYLPSALTPPFLSPPLSYLLSICVCMHMCVSGGVQRGGSWGTHRVIGIPSPIQGQHRTTFSLRTALYFTALHKITFISCTALHHVRIMHSTGALQSHYALYYLPQTLSKRHSYLFNSIIKQDIFTRLSTHLSTSLSAVLLLSVS